MRFYKIRLYAVVIAAVLIFLCCPRMLSHVLRDKSITILSPLWRGFQKSSIALPKSLTSFEIFKTLDTLKKQKEDLERDKQILSSQLRQVQEFLFSKQLIENDIDALKSIKESLDEEASSKEFFQRRYQELKTRLALQLESVDAKVVYREPTSWSSFIWIDKGSEYNKLCGVEIIAENSPVVIGNAIVGVVEYVGKNKSKIRLITDEKLVISVRALRGYSQNRLLHDALSLVSDQLKFRKELFFSTEEQDNTLKILEDLSQNIELLTSDHYMAKGEIHGSSLPLWRCRSQKLKGVGFNYDFDDEEGAARDLRTGRSFSPNPQDVQKALLQEGDLLVTTGMDGIFPAGFHVGVITYIHPLEDGSFYYNLEAKAIAPHLDEIEKVSILAPRQNK